MSIKKLWNNYALSGLNLTPADVAYRRVYLINTLMITGVVTFLFFTLFNLFVTQLYAIMAIDIVGLLLSLFTIATLRKWHNIELASTLVVLIIFFSTLGFIMIEANKNFAFIYLIFLPLFAIFLKGVRQGLIYTVLYFVLVFTFILTQKSQWEPAPFTDVSLVNILTTIIAFTFLIRYYEKSRSEAFDAVKASEIYTKEQSLRLEALNEELKLQEEHLRLANKELYEYQNNLEAKVDAMVAQKRAQEQLMVQQSKMATAGEMIASIIHQWKQPLSTTNMMINNLQMSLELDKLSDDELALTLNKVIEQTNFMTQTIKDFSSFFKPRKVKEPFHLSAAIENVEKIFTPQLLHHHVKLIKKLPEEALMIHGYKNEFLHVLLNLLNNAKDAMIENQTAQPTITLEARKDNEKILLSITDNGGGIPLEIMPKLFEPYFTTKEASQGTGIGLYMSKIIIQEHMHGTIDVENVQEGARFTITL